MLGIGLYLLFIPVYFGVNWLTSLRQQRYHLYLGWELGIPFVPEMMLGYVSLLLLFLLPPFALSPAALSGLARRFVMATLIAALIFLLLPAELGFARTAVSGPTGSWFQLLRDLDLPHNLVPSLHVAYATMVLAAVGSVSGPWLRRLLALWFGVICLSTLLVHQHHLLDVAGGLFLGGGLHLQKGWRLASPGGSGYS